MRRVLYHAVVLVAAVQLCLGNHGSALERHDEPTGQPIPVGRSIWRHNGSAVYLVADGERRQFYYQKPNMEAEKHGAKSGTLLFDGVLVGDRYVGTAYTLSRECGSNSYRVRGFISSDQRRITLRGSLPLRNMGCQEVASVEHALIFDFVFTKEPDRSEQTTLSTAPGPIKASILANPKANFASDAQVAQPSQDDIANTLVNSIISGSYAISTCYDSQHDILASSSNDFFIAYYFHVVSFHAATSAMLNKLGYPEDLWGPALQDLSESLLDDISQRLEYGDFTRIISPRTDTLTDMLAEALDNYRLARSPGLLPTENRCVTSRASYRRIEAEGPSVTKGRFAVKLVPEGRIWLMRGFDYDWCRKRGYDITSLECDFWIQVVVGQTLPFGHYRYRAEWPDGVKEVERLPPLDNWSDVKMVIKIRDKAIEINVHRL